MDQELIEMHVIVHGRVQGVGFRALVRSYAEQLRLNGTACNLADGSVEIYLQGTQPQLNAFRQQLEKNPGLGSIESWEIHYYKAFQPLPNFQIIHKA